MSLPIGGVSVVECVRLSSRCCEEWRVGAIDLAAVNQASVHRHYWHNMAAASCSLRTHTHAAPALHKPDSLPPASVRHVRSLHNYKEYFLNPFMPSGLFNMDYKEYFLNPFMPCGLFNMDYKEYFLNPFMPCDLFDRGRLDAYYFSI